MENVYSFYTRNGEERQWKDGYIVSHLGTSKKKKFLHVS